MEVSQRTVDPQRSALEQVHAEIARLTALTSQKQRGKETSNPTALHILKTRLSLLQTIVTTHLEQEEEKTRTGLGTYFSRSDRFFSGICGAKEAQLLGGIEEEVESQA